MNREQTFQIRSLLYSLIVCYAIAGCGEARIPATFESFAPVDLNASISSAVATGKIDNFVVVMDTSSTMNNLYLYEAFDSSTVPTLFEVEKEVVRRLNQTIPDMNLNAGIRTYGFGPCQSWGFSLERLKFGPYQKESFTDALNSIDCAGGGSPLDYALEMAGSDLESANGNTAIIIISDGDVDESAAVAAVELKKQYDKRICIHTISLGKNPANRLAMRRLAALSGCGYTTTAEEVATASGMAEFVEKVFIKANRGLQTKNR
jgi:OmpA-OmpF porin, OOP family